MQGTLRHNFWSAQTDEPSDGDGCQSCPGPCRLHQNTRPIIAAGALCSARVGGQARFSHTQFHRANPRITETRARLRILSMAPQRSSGPALPILPFIDPFNLAFIKRPPASYLRLPGSGHEATRLSPVPRSAARHGQSFPAEPLDPTKCGPPQTETRPFFLAGCCFLNGTPCTTRPKSASPSCGASSSFQTLLLP